LLAATSAASPMQAGAGSPMQAGEGARAGSFELVKAASIREAETTLATAAGSKGLVSPKDGGPFTVVVYAEEKKAAKEFEWHEARDHIFQVLEGTTRVELGGDADGSAPDQAGRVVGSGVRRSEGGDA